jgi:maltose alpha-D-glucosyltransferase/alpha-amylase
MEETLWYKNAVFYEVYLRAFYDDNGDGHGDLRGLAEKLDYLQDLGIDCIWLMPFYPSPLKDDGYDISDYYGVHPTYGKPEDIKELVRAAHEHGIRVIADLVLNHTSDQHPWFQAARRDRLSPYRNYYVWSDTGREYSQARIIFLDTEKSNWTWDEVAGQYFWHRFYSSQPDLNFDEPQVQDEILNVMKYWLDIGLDGFRADAVPYLFEREDTNCENLPETHAYLKRMRALIDGGYPDRILLCEANQWPKDVRPYFGDGNEFHMAFHFPLMPRIFMALRRGDRDPLVWVLQRTPAIPENCQWSTFLRNHDELTLEMVTEEERQWMWREYAPQPRMRLNLGIRRRLAPLLDNDRRKIELANSLLFTLPGSPVIYYGDEIGMGDNLELFDRNGMRTPMQWDDTPQAGFSKADPSKFYAQVIQTSPYDPRHVNVADQKLDPASLFNVIRKMVAVRKAHPAFGSANLSWAEAGSQAVAAYWRFSPGEALLILNNLSGASQSVIMPMPEDASKQPLDLLSDNYSAVVENGKLSLTLAPYQFIWLNV